MLNSLKTVFDDMPLLRDFFKYLYAMLQYFEDDTEDNCNIEDDIEDNYRIRAVALLSW